MHNGRRASGRRAGLGFIGYRQSLMLAVAVFTDDVR
jgi:hypothetical protein